MISSDYVFTTRQSPRHRRSCPSTASKSAFAKEPSFRSIIVRLVVRMTPATTEGNSKSGSLPVADQLVAEQRPADVTGNGRHHDFLPRTVMRGGANDYSRPELLFGFIAYSWLFG